jgi:hypothetical protein
MPVENMTYGNTREASKNVWRNLKKGSNAREMLAKAVLRLADCCTSLSEFWMNRSESLIDLGYRIDPSMEEQDRQAILFADEILNPEEVTRLNG